MKAPRNDLRNGEAARTATSCPVDEHLTTVHDRMKERQCRAAASSGDDAANQKWRSRRSLKVLCYAVGSQRRGAEPERKKARGDTRSDHPPQFSRRAWPDWKAGKTKSMIRFSSWFSLMHGQMGF